VIRTQAQQLPRRIKAGLVAGRGLHQAKPDNWFAVCHALAQLFGVRTITAITAMQRLAKGWRRDGVRVGFVPTMGYLHEGHMSLVRRARKATGENGRVVVSIYVNPSQFGPHEDLKKYPRDMPRDLQLCRKAGADVVFAPRDEEMYPGGSNAAANDSLAFSTYVFEEQMSRGMEGASRPTHFRGVTTVVAKLFNIVLPDVAVFGAKDYQQAAVIQRMVRDLNFPVRIVVAPTRRESDGLAMSSRNKYLVGKLRAQARVLSQALRAAQNAVRRSKGGLPAGKLRSELRRLISAQPDARLDYIEFVEDKTLKPAKSVKTGTRLVLAVFVGSTRLIDNARL